MSNETEIMVQIFFTGPSRVPILQELVSACEALVKFGKKNAWAAGHKNGTTMQPAELRFVTFDYEGTNRQIAHWLRAMGLDVKIHPDVRRSDLIVKMAQCCDGMFVIFNQHSQTVADAITAWNTRGMTTNGRAKLEIFQVHHLEWEKNWIEQERDEREEEEFLRNHPQLREGKE